MGRPQSFRPAALIVLLIAATSVHGQTGSPPSGAPRQGLPPRDASRPAATGTARIRGRVVSPDAGAPLRRARVALQSPEAGSRRVVTSDAQGRYEFADLPDGRQAIAFVENTL